MNTNDHELIARSLAEPAAFADLFDLHAATVHRYAASRTDRQTADDLLSETFLVAFDKRGNFDAERGAVRAWLLGITTTLIRKHRRTEARAYAGLAADKASRILSADAYQEADARLDAAASVRDLARALAKLAPGDRDVVLLYAWEELSYQDIALALDIPLGTVRSRLNRARTKLGANMNFTEDFNAKETGHGFAGTTA